LAGGVSATSTANSSDIAPPTGSGAVIAQCTTARRAACGGRRHTSPQPRPCCALTKVALLQAPVQRDAVRVQRHCGRRVVSVQWWLARRVLVSPVRPTPTQLVATSSADLRYL
jgi:hypothetical protein